jgi:metal-sulfur cluster biosynthetic enzyme
VTAHIRDALRDVIDPCCKDRGISVVDMGLLHDVDVDDDGRARIDIMLTSGWCPFQVDLTAEISQAATAVEGVTDAEVHITLDQVWSPARMAPDARGKLRLLPDPGEVADRDAFVAAAPLPVVQITRTPSATTGAAR